MKKYSIESFEHKLDKIFEVSSFTGRIRVPEYFNKFLDMYVDKTVSILIKRFENYRELNKDINDFLNSLDTKEESYKFLAYQYTISIIESEQLKSMIIDNFKYDGIENLKTKDLLFTLNSIDLDKSTNNDNNLSYKFGSFRREEKYDVIMICIHNILIHDVNSIIHRVESSCNFEHFKPYFEKLFNKKVIKRKIQSTFYHEIQHWIQYNILIPLKYMKELPYKQSSDDYEKYLTQGIEFYPQITTSLGYLRSWLNKRLELTNNFDPQEFLSSFIKYNPFFKNLKRVDKNKWKKAIKIFYQLILEDKELSSLLWTNNPFFRKQDVRDYISNLYL